MINLTHLIKYIIIFTVVTVSTFFIPNCNIISKHSIYIGLLAASTFVLLDKCFPYTVVINQHEDKI